MFNRKKKIISRELLSILLGHRVVSVLREADVQLSERNML
jgi:hypothetical protein